MDFEPRGQFAERFALLYAEAGDPPLKRIAESVTRARRVDERGRPVGVTTQRVSDWRRGRNVPARFAGLATVLEILIGQARKRRPTPIVAELYDLNAWKTLWQQARDSPIPIAEASAEQPTEQPMDTGACPYRGLASFRQEDAGWFFGRARSTEALVEKLTGERGTGLIMLVGASGAGKSSLIAAGLLPALGEDVVAVTMTPRDDPVHELTNRIPELGDAVKLACEDGEFGSAVHDGLTEYLDHQDRPAARLALVVDQFEETFTLCLDEQQRQLFIRTLHTLSTTPGTTVLIGLRADFYGHCLEHAELADALQHRQLVLGPMTAAELREAIIGPAKSVGLQLEAGLADLIVRDVGAGTGRTRTGTTESVHDAGVLPLLSHALLATWQRRQPGSLTIEGYRATRGIQGAVAATAERAWAELDQSGQAAARAILLRLVRIGEDMRDTRRRSTREQLVEHAEDPLAAEKALEVLTAARLVTLDTRSVEITHEALLQAWPRLRSWIDQDRAGNLLRQRLEEDAASWDGQERESSLLYRGARLETTTQWLKTV
ncbi:MAG TPA: hypothetical protein VJX66_27100, partial [Amycolatopsis sp.]|nr:hypothetical protein [Amycolatopsis sp.]